MFVVLQGSLVVFGDETFLPTRRWPKLCMNEVLKTSWIYSLNSCDNIPSRTNNSMSFVRRILHCIMSNTRPAEPTTTCTPCSRLRISFRTLLPPMHAWHEIPTKSPGERLNFYVWTALNTARDWSKKQRLKSRGSCVDRLENRDGERRSLPVPDVELWHSLNDMQSVNYLTLTNEATLVSR